MTVITSAISPVLIPTVRAEVLHHWRDVPRLTNGRYHAEDFIEECEEGRSVLFAAVKQDDLKVLGAACVSVIAYPRRQILMVKYVGGTEMRQWIKPLGDMVFQFSYETKCSGVEGYGRLGWLKVFPEMKTTALFMETVA